MNILLPDYSQCVHCFFNVAALWKAAEKHRGIRKTSRFIVQQYLSIVKYSLGGLFMDISQKLISCSDKVIQQFLRKLDSEKLAVLMAYHLSDEATDCILRNMSERAQESVLKEREEFKQVAVTYEKLLDQTAKDFS
ncbi:MAG: hypothetical protein JW822_08875 [Spirochaetales bacterium]|nr:hypothetical protein [Spirochaetales bacterium]